MTIPDPYAPPSAEERVALPEGPDLYLETLPPPLLKAAVGVLGLMGAMMLLFALRLWLALRATPMATVLELVHLVSGVLSWVVAWGIYGGRAWLVWVGLLLSPIVGVASLFALLTGSIGGLLTGGLALANLVLLLLNVSHVQRIGRARAAMRVP